MLHAVRRADQVEAAVWEALRTFLTQPQVIHEQVNNAEIQIAHMEKELSALGHKMAELARRRSNLIDLYEYGKFNAEELDKRMERLQASQAMLERKKQDCWNNIETYRKRQVDPYKIRHVLAQIDEIIRFAKPEYHREIVHALCRHIKVTREGKLEIAATLPREPRRCCARHLVLSNAASAD